MKESRQNQNQNQNQATKGRKGSPKIDPLEFWGDPEALSQLDETVHEKLTEQSAGDPRALLNSLGRPPLPGQEVVAERWLTLVFERSAFLAEALAVAAELNDNGSE